MTDRVLYDSPYTSFNCKSYSLNSEATVATFIYQYDDADIFVEKLFFGQALDTAKPHLINELLRYYFIAAGTSYYKLFPTQDIRISSHSITHEQASFFTELYRGGLSQFVYENNLLPASLGSFCGSDDVQSFSTPLENRGILLLQSGGKDSLLAASLLQERGVAFDAFHASSNGEYPKLLEEVGASKLLVVRRQIDMPAITRARVAGGLNGHVPFSAIIAGAALISAVGSGNNMVLAANEASSDEPNEMIGDYEVNHMYSKTYSFELSLQQYLHENVSPDIQYASLLRKFGDLHIAELFSQKTWSRFGHTFASCNTGNYQQGTEGTTLKWCANCSKCLNSFLLFAPFIEYDELLKVFGGTNMLVDASQQKDLRALLGVEGVKPFECVGTVDELRAAYSMALQKDQRYDAGIAVPDAREDFRKQHPHQSLVDALLSDVS